VKSRAAQFAARVNIDDRDHAVSIRLGFVTGLESEIEIGTSRGGTAITLGENIQMIYLQPNQWRSSDSINAYALQTSTGKYIMDSANEPWSFYSPDNYVYRFAVTPGDHWFADPYGIERAEIGGTTQYANGTPINVSYSFKIEPGAANTSKWMVLGQLHQNDYAGEASASLPSRSP
jgi:hypothetical protein